MLRFLAWIIIFVFLFTSFVASWFFYTFMVVSFMGKLQENSTVVILLPFILFFTPYFRDVVADILTHYITHISELRPNK